MVQNKKESKKNGGALQRRQPSSATCGTRGEIEPTTPKCTGSRSPYSKVPCDARATARRVSSTQRRCAQPRTRAPRCDANTGRSCRCPDAYCVSLRAVKKMKTTGATLTHTALSRKAVRSTVWYVLYSTVLKPYSKICTVGTKSFLFTFYATWPFLASVRPEGTGSATNSLATVP